MTAKYDLCQIYVQRLEGNLQRIDPLKASFTGEQQTDTFRPRELKMTVDRGVTVDLNDRIIVKKLGRAVFRGYAKFISIKNRFEKEITCAGMEDLLLYRTTPRFFYDKYNTDLMIGEVVADELREGAWPGLLACANSYLLPGSAVEKYNSGSYASEVYIWPAAGLKSCFGSRKIFYLNSYGIFEMDEISDLDTLTGGADPDIAVFYRDDWNLYFQIGENQEIMTWYTLGGLFIENWKDTTIRLGYVSDVVANSLIGRALMMDGNVIGDLILDICNTYGYYIMFTDDDDYTYLNIFDGNDRDTNEGVYTFYEDDLSSIEKLALDEPLFSTIQGKGEGMAVNTRIDYSPYLSTRLECVKEWEGAFDSGLFGLGVLVDATFDNQRNNDRWIIEPVRNDLIIWPGDYVKIALDFEEVQVLRAVRVEEDLLNGHLRLDLSAHNVNMADVWEFTQNIDTSFSDFYPAEICDSQSAEVYESEETDSFLNSDTWGYFTLHLPGGVLNSDLDPCVMLSLNLQQGDSDDFPTEADALGRCDVLIEINSAGYESTWLICHCGITLSESANFSIPDFDITDCLMEGADDADISVGVYIAGNSSGAVPDYESLWFTGSATLKFFKRAG